MLYVDAHRPNDLDKLHYHHDLSKRIRALAGTGQDFPHLLVYGPSGAGKKTRIMCILKELYGKGVEKVQALHWIRVEKVLMVYHHCYSSVSIKESS